MSSLVPPRSGCNLPFTKPIAQLGPHTAPLGMSFYTGPMFPARCVSRGFGTAHIVAKIVD